MVVGGRLLLRLDLGVATRVTAFLPSGVPHSIEGIKKVNMSLPWFRLYSEFATDPKVQLLAFEDQRHFIILLCLKCNGTLDTNAVSEQHFDRLICKSLGLDMTSGSEAKRRLIEVGLIGQDWQPTKWDARQFKSDNSTARVHKFRSKTQRNVSETLQKRPRNGIEQIQNRTDTDNKEVANAPLVIHQSLPKAEWEEWLSFRREKKFPMSPRTLNMQLKVLARHSTAEQCSMIETSINAGWQGLFPPKGIKGAMPQPKIGWVEERDLIVGPKGRIYDEAKRQGKTFGSQQEFDDYAEVLRKVRA